MQTNQLMKRTFYRTEVTQRTKDGFFNATDLLKYYNLNNETKKVMAEFWATQGTKDFMEALAFDINVNLGKNIYLAKDLYTTTRGKGGSTYMNPYLFVKFAMWLSPAFEVQILKWVYDNLIEFRNQAGDHYKEMCSAIQERYVQATNKKPDPLVFQNEARLLNQLVFGDAKTRSRNEASVEELDKINRLQLANIKLLKDATPSPERHKRLREFAQLV